MKGVSGNGFTMIRLRRFAIIIFVLAVLEFAFFSLYRYMHEDRTGPEIVVSSQELEISVKDGEDVLLKGVTAKDDHDGTVTDRLMVENISNFTSEGKRIVTYVAVDSSGNVSRETRTVSYTDYRKPQFEVSNAPRFSVTELDSATDYSKYIRAKDLIDGDITKNIKVISVDDYTENDYGGSQKVTFQVSNSAGDTSTLPVMISYTENGAPFVNLSSYVVYLKKDASFNPGNYMASVEIGSNKYSIADFREGQKGTIEIRNKVNVKEAGVYTVEFAARSENGKSSVAYMEVIVQ